MTKRSVRRPRVDFDARGIVATHGVHTPKRAIIHDTESHGSKGIRDLQGICHYWAHDTPGYGAQIIVNQYGKSALCADPTKICWHVENRNTGSVGIEMVGFASYLPQLWFLHQRQMHKTARWLAWLNKDHGIPLRFDIEHGVSRHADQSRHFGGSHWDPGSGYPLNALLRLAKTYRAKGWY
jgi:hypothetical protein